MATTRIFALFNLKLGQDPAAYEAWARSTDIPAVRALGSVDDFQVAKVEGLLGSDADALVNDQPELRIDPRFWNEFNRNGFHQCAFREVCGSRQCLGLNAAYVREFGWHEDLLKPLPRSA